MSRKSGSGVKKEVRRAGCLGLVGDIVEREENKKVFLKEDLDERGEIPPPFNLERFNFNCHDIRGFFERDKNGKEVVGKSKNKKG
jgi:hypothetical protein